MNRYRLIQQQSQICYVFQISNVYIVFDKKQVLLRPGPVSYERGIIFKIKVWCFLNSCLLYAGHYCSFSEIGIQKIFV